MKSGQIDVRMLNGVVVLVLGDIEVELEPRAAFRLNERISGLWKWFVANERLGR